MRRLDFIIQRARIKRALGHIQTGTLLLDIGCHQGELSGYLVDKHCRYFGIDPDVVVPTTNLIRGHFPNDLPPDWKGMEFDHGVALAVLEHVPMDELVEFLRSVRDVLRPGGTLIATIPSPATDKLLVVLRRTRLIDGMDLDAHDGLTLAQLLGAAEETGLRLVSHDQFQLGLNNLLVWARV
jgi:cyclopropane fatty-acyl-phospholipid synthase-like methyltransferase